jgi:MFS family permease
MAKLSDLYGRRNIYIINLIIFALGSLIVAISPTIGFSVLILGRAIQGFGAGGIFPVASAVIGDLIPKEKQGSALGLIGAMFGLAFILGPIIGGLLLMISWHWIFILNIPIAGIIIYYAYQLLPSKKVEGKINFDWKGMSLLILSLILFAWAINHIDSTNFVNSLMTLNVLPFFILSIIAINFFYRTEIKKEYPIYNIQLLRSKKLILVYLLAFGAGLAEIGTVYIPGFAREAFSLSDSKASFMLLPLVFSLAIGSPIFGRMLDKIGAKLIILLGTILISFGLFLLATISDYLTGFYIGSIILGFGISSLVGAPLRFIINHETNEENRAAGQSIVSLFTSIGMLLGAALLGALVASMGGGTAAFQRAFLVLALISFFLFLVSLKLKKKE